MKDPDLWNRLTDHDFPLDDKGKTLLSHLVDQTTLGKTKAPIAIQEYRKFLYLAATSGEIVAPSPLIDRLWHTHIEHTRAYFDDFCPRIIGHVIHHAPGRDSAAHDPAYQRTLDLIGQEFRQTPLFPVWPPQQALRRRSRQQAQNFGFGAALVLGLILAQNFRALGLTLLFVGFAGLILINGVIPLLADRPWTIRPRKTGTGCSSCGGSSGGDGDSDGGCGGGGGD